MSGFTISRRLLLAGSSILLASTALPTIGQAQEPKKGGRLIVAANSEPRNLNPAIVASNGVFFVASKVVEPLAEASSTARTAWNPPCHSWEGSADGLTVTFKLREGVTWHDGKPFTSADVAFSALAGLEAAAESGRVVFKDLEAVDTPDEHTAVFRFSTPTPFQLIRNALPALTTVCPGTSMRAPTSPKIPANTAPVGTGPFKFAEHKPGEFYRLTRNEAIGARACRIWTRSSSGSCPTAPPRPVRWKPRKSSSRPSRPCRLPISIASPRCRASR